MPRKQKDAIDRFLEKVDKTDSCWLWKGGISTGGYGRFSFKLKSVAAHRWSYEWFKGAIPDGYQIDHLCRNRACVNPDHLEAVLPRENTLRGNTPAAANAQKTHCPRWHPLNERRICPVCAREATARWKAAHYEQARAKQREYEARPENRARISEMQRARRAKDPEAYRTYMREYYQKRKAKQAEDSTED